MIISKIRTSFILLSIFNCIVIAQWTRQLDVSVSPFFITKDVGWATGENYNWFLGPKDLYKTTNSGSNWEIIPTPKYLNKVFFVNENDGYATSITYESPYVYYTSRIFKTTDGGINWELKLEKLTSELRNIFFIDDKTGWACFDSLFATTDGGETWECQFSEDGDIRDVYFINKNKGWLLTWPGHYYLTEDGGNTWHFSNTPLIRTINFISENLGFSSIGNATYKTSDAGSSWTKVGNVGSDNEINFLNENVGFMNAGGIYKTENGGQDWFELSSPAGDSHPSISSIAVIDENNIWVTTPDGLFKRDVTIGLTLLSPDGGETLYSGYQFEIIWDHINLENRYVQLDYSTDNGSSWLQIVDSVFIEDKQYQWSLPEIPNSNDCLIRITELQSQLSDVSDDVFSIIKETRELTITKPAGGEIYRSNSQIEVAWESNYSTSSNLMFAYTWSSSVNFPTVPITDGSCIITAPGAYHQGEIQLKIWDEDNPQINTISNIFYVKYPQWLYIDLPGEAEVWSIDSTMTISFISTDVELVQIDYSTDNGENWLLVTDSVQADSNAQIQCKYQWPIPDTPSKNCRLKLSSVYEPDVFVISNVFEITDKEVTGLFPLAVGNKWFYRYSYSYNEPYHPEGIQAIWEDVDTVELQDEETYHLLRISRRVEQDQNIFALYDTCYIRQDKNVVIVKNISGKENFIPDMNFEISFFKQSYIDTLNLFGRLLRDYRIGWDFFAHTITDSLGFSVYNWSEQRHGYGGFASIITGCILDGVVYGEIQTDCTVGLNEQNQEINDGYKLSQNYPNPFNPSTTISYLIPEAGIVSLKVYDLLGREIAVLVNEEKAPGRYKIIFEGIGLASGVYYYQLRSGSFVETKKLMLMK